MYSYEGDVCYCIEPGVPQSIGDTYTKRDENYWDNYPSAYNKTITPDKIKQLIEKKIGYMMLFENHDNIIIQKKKD